VTGQDWLGRVVVCAGDDPRLDDVAHLAAARGAQVARIATRADLAAPDAVATFRADASNGTVWVRIGMHVEQHLGPVDAVIADPASAVAVAAYFDADLDRRGRPATVTIGPADDAGAVISSLGRRL
jgi:hypothetical protein